MLKISFWSAEGSYMEKRHVPEMLEFLICLYSNENHIKHSSHSIPLALGSSV